MSGCVIVIRDLDTRERLEIGTLANLPEAKEIAEARAAQARAEGRRVAVAVMTPRGNRHRLIPRTRNTGPGRFYWRAE
jgi:uncharacterized protein GlcG (DUF336 family)